MDTMDYFFAGVGFVTVGVVAVCAACALGSWAAGFCKLLYSHGKITYLHSRMRRKLTALNGEYVSRWLTDYSLTHGFINKDFNAWQWNEYFSKEIMKNRK